MVISFQFGLCALCSVLSSYVFFFLFGLDGSDFVLAPCVVSVSAHEPFVSCLYLMSMTQWCVLLPKKMNQFYVYVIDCIISQQDSELNKKVVLSCTVYITRESHFKVNKIFSAPTLIYALLCRYQSVKNKISVSYSLAWSMLHNTCLLTISIKRTLKLMANFVSPHL